MTYQELKEKTIIDHFSNYGWEDKSEEDALSEIRTQLQRYGDRQMINMLTDVDKNLNTSVQDLLEALQRQGFPQDKITVVNEQKAQIVLGKQSYTLFSNQLGHSFLYNGNNSREYFDFAHTPADMVAEYLVERYCSGNWLEEELQRRMAIFRDYKVKKNGSWKRWSKFNRLNEELHEAVLAGEAYDGLRKKYFDAGRACYTAFDEPEISEAAIKEEIAKRWEKTIKEAKQEIKNEQKAIAAHEHYEKVVKPRNEAKKQAIVDWKRALLQEYKEQYDLTCRFIHVRGLYFADDLFVVPATKNQVVSFVDNGKLDRKPFDNALKLVEYLNELTEKHGKTKVQNSSSLPKEEQKALEKRLRKLKLEKIWRGIYNESQRHYLSGTYKVAVDL